MKVIADRTTVVLVGAFNPAILQPNWVAVHGLGFSPEHQFQVDMLSAIGSGSPSRYTFEGISYSAGFRNFTLHLGDSSKEDCVKAVMATSKILQQLPHTPVYGLGINFGFLVSQPSEQLLGLLTEHDALLGSFEPMPDVVTKRWGNTLKWNDSLVSVDCELAGGQVTVTFNFHYEAASASAAQSILERADIIEVHRQCAVSAARALTGEDLEG